MFRVKICGLTTPEDAACLAGASVDAAGLNFYSRSVRFVSHDSARQIAAALPQGVLRVGVFVNASSAEILRCVRQTPLDCVQLHGDEPPEQLVELGPTPLVKAFACTTDFLDRISRFLDAADRLGRRPDLILLDAAAQQVRGGSGQTADWSLARRYHELPGAPPLVLAGGLRAENVARAIAEVRPSAVDTASGVESSPGRKDPALVRAFAAAARSNWSTKTDLDEVS